MNYESESSSQQPTMLEQLVQQNQDTVNVREYVPYQPIVYAIPAEWREEEVEMLRKAVKFQPELYRLIQLCATRQDIQKMQQQHLLTIRKELEAQTNSVQRMLQQDGSVREKFSSDCSKILSDSRREMKSIVEDLQVNIRKIVMRTAVSSVILSVLACILLQHLLS